MSNPDVVQMNRRLRFCAWCGLCSLPPMFLATWLLWGMFPPIAATLSDDQVVQHFRANPAAILAGAIVAQAGLGLFIAFNGGVAACMRRAEGSFTPLSDGYSMLIPFAYFTLLLVPVLFSTMAFRAMPPEMIRMLCDLALIIFVWNGLIGTVLYGLLGIAVLGDRRPHPIFPRWIGYMSIWVALLAGPGCLVTLFPSGPFAWNGLFGYWVPTAAFGTFTMALIWSMLEASKHPDLIDDDRPDPLTLV